MRSSKKYAFLALTAPVVIQAYATPFQHDPDAVHEEQRTAPFHSVASTTSSASVTVAGVLSFRAPWADIWVEETILEATHPASPIAEARAETAIRPRDQS